MSHPDLNVTTSSTVDAFGYVASNVPGPGSLFVQFKSSKIYRYVVPLVVLNELDAAPSKGQYINQMKKIYQGLLISDDEVTAAFATAKTAQATKGKSAVRKVRIPKNIVLRYPVIANFF